MNIKNFASHKLCSLWHPYPPVTNHRSSSFLRCDDIFRSHNHTSYISSFVTDKNVSSPLMRTMIVQSNESLSAAEVKLTINHRTYEAVKNDTIIAIGRRL